MKLIGIRSNKVITKSDKTKYVYIGSYSYMFMCCEQSISVFGLELRHIKDDVFEAGQDDLLMLGFTERFLS